MEKWQTHTVTQGAAYRDRGGCAIKADRWGRSQGVHQHAACSFGRRRVPIIPFRAAEGRVWCSPCPSHLATSPHVLLVVFKPAITTKDAGLDHLHETSNRATASLSNCTATIESASRRANHRRRNAGKSEKVTQATQCISMTVVVLALSGFMTPHMPVGCVAAA